MDKLFLYLEEIGLSYEEKEKILSIIDEWLLPFLYFLLRKYP
jgi:hypothetical protein